MPSHLCRYVTRLGSIALLYCVVGETEGGGEKCYVFTYLCGYGVEKLRYGEGRRAYVVITYLCRHGHWCKIW